jgi:peptidoglycan/xylan/chitin deacetylase (PgdA/CDA1 family)
MTSDNIWYPYEGALTLTFDDGTPSQLRTAVPLLDRYRFRGSLYPTPVGSFWARSAADWKAVAASGHELGNHTLSHRCPEAVSGKAPGLEHLTLDELEADILAAQDRLHDIVPDQNEWSFCYPCYSTFVGTGLNRKSYVPLIARHFVAGRGGGEFGFANRPGRFDIHCLWSTPVEHLSGFEMIGLVEELCSRGQWLILTVHDIDSGTLPVDRMAFVQLLEFLSRNRERFRVGPLIEIALEYRSKQSRSTHASTSS